MAGNKKYIILVIGIVSLGLLLTGGTYAYLSFTASVTNATYNGTSTCFLVDYGTTVDQSSLPINGYLFQSSTPKGGLLSTVTMNIKSGCSVNGKGYIYLNVGSATGSKLFQNNALKYAVYENVNSEPVSSGVISQTGEMTLYGDFTLSETAKNYYIYIWLDGNIADNSYVNIPFSGYIHASATQTE